jgi:hypothetical protein
MSPGAQNMKTGADALGTVENVFGSSKHENESDSAKQENGRRRPRYCRKRVPTPSVPPKKSSGAQNLKKGADGLAIVENEFGSSKHENECRRPRYRKK